MIDAEDKKAADFAAAMVLVNRSMTKREIRKKCRLGRNEFEFHWSSKKNLWGRFGGGWNWNLGIQCGRTVVILELLVFSLSWRRRAAKPIAEA